MSKISSSYRTSYFQSTASKPLYQQTLYKVKEIRKQIFKRCGRIYPLGHYTEPRVNGAMTKYYGVNNIENVRSEILDVIDQFNSQNKPWEASVHFNPSPGTYSYRISVPQIVIHVKFK